MRALRRIAAAVGALSAVTALVGIVAHHTGAVSSTAVRLASFTPLLVLFAVPAVLLTVLARRWVAASLAVVLMAVGAGTQAPLFHGARGSEAADAAVRVRLLQANIRLGKADADSLVRSVREEDADLLTVAELTPDAVARLTAAGIDTVLPYSFLRPKYGGGGVGIYSRFTLRDGTLLSGYFHNNVRAVAAIPGAAPTTIYAVHIVAPYPEPAWKWAGELRRLRGQLAADHAPLIVGGDFNATYDHRLFRQLLRDSTGSGAAGMHGAAEYLGSGIVATYPANRRFPAFLAIDHILTRGGIPLSLHRVDLPGSDHHGVVGDIGLAPVG